MLLHNYPIRVDIWLGTEVYKEIISNVLIEPRGRHYLSHTYDCQFSASIAHFLVLMLDRRYDNVKNHS